MSVGGFLSTEEQNVLQARIGIVESASGVEIVFRVVLGFSGRFAALVLSVLAIALPILIAWTAITTESNDELLTCIVGFLAFSSGMLFLVLHFGRRLAREIENLRKPFDLLVQKQG